MKKGQKLVAMVLTGAMCRIADSMRRQQDRSDDGSRKTGGDHRSGIDGKTGGSRSKGNRGGCSWPGV